MVNSIRVISRLVEVRLAIERRVIVVHLEPEPAGGVVDIGEGEPRDGEEDGEDELAPQLGDRRERQQVRQDDRRYDAVSWKE